MKHPESPDCIKNLYRKITSLYPDFVFKRGKKFAFRPPKTIILGPDEHNSALLLLHELGHATLGHKTYKTDIERLKKESEAWEQAHIIADNLNIPFDQNFAQNELDSYREWLHNKSRCKKCNLTRFQTPDGKYHCPKCDS